MKKYLKIISVSLQEYFAYKMNLIIWRLRIIISIMISYFLWDTVYQSKPVIFGYDISRMLTYFLLLFLVNSLVLNSQTFRIAEDINFGYLSNYLLRPLNYFLFVLSR